MQFYWLTAFGPITGDPENCQIWGWYWNINKNISFHFRVLPRKANNKIFWKIQKTLFWGHVAILAIFSQIWAEMYFPGKKSLCQFLNIPIICHLTQNQKKLICHYSWGKCWTDGWMDRQMEGWTDNHDFVGPWSNY